MESCVYSRYFLTLNYATHISLHLIYPHLELHFPVDQESYPQNWVVVSLLVKYSFLGPVSEPRIDGYRILVTQGVGSKTCPPLKL